MHSIEYQRLVSRLRLSFVILTFNSLASKTYYRYVRMTLTFSPVLKFVLLPVNYSSALVYVDLVILTFESIVNS